MATSDPSCNEEAFEPASPLRPSAPAAAMVAAPPSAAAPVAPEEDDLTKAKRIAFALEDRSAVAEQLRHKKTSLSTAAE